MTQMKSDELTSRAQQVILDRLRLRGELSVPQDIIGILNKEYPSVALPDLFDAAGTAYQFLADSLFAQAAELRQNTDSENP